MQDAWQKWRFWGLGVMGFPMAGHLAAKRACGDGLQPHRRQGRGLGRKTWRQRGRQPRARRRTGADFVMACVGNDDDLRSVCLGPDGAFAGMATGAVFVDHTTVSARSRASCPRWPRAKGIGFVDAPVSGGQAGAENGVLSVMCGGDAEPTMRAPNR